MFAQRQIYKRMRSILKKTIKKCMNAWGMKFEGSHQETYRNINTQAYWNQVWSKQGLRGRDHPVLHQKIIDLIPEHSIIIDLGCGNGQLLRKIRQRNDHYSVGLDFSDEILRQLQVFNIPGIQAQLPLLPCCSESFDVVICSETLEHLSFPEELLKQIYRITQIDGLIILSVPDGMIWSQRGGEHVNIFTATDCVELLRPYVDAVHLITINEDGWPMLLFWGRKMNTIVQYENIFAEYNHKMRQKCQI